VTRRENQAGDEGLVRQLRRDDKRERRRRDGEVHRYRRGSCLGEKGPEKRPVFHHKSDVHREAFETLVHSPLQAAEGMSRTELRHLARSWGAQSESSWHRREISSIRVIKFAGYRSRSVCQ